jgi:hypothetical protein
MGKSFGQYAYRTVAILRSRGARASHPLSSSHTTEGKQNRQRFLRSPIVKQDQRRPVSRDLRTDGMDSFRASCQACQRQRALKRLPLPVRVLWISSSFTGTITHPPFPYLPDSVCVCVRGRGNKGGTYVDTIPEAAYSSHDNHRIPLQ